MRMTKKQGGFTLVEIAIVLVIVGLLLAGVLKGQELIENGKIKNIAKDLDSMTAVTTSYKDRYRGLPGDERYLGAALRRITRRSGHARACATARGESVGSVHHGPAHALPA